MNLHQQTHAKKGAKEDNGFESKNVLWMEDTALGSVLQRKKKCFGMERQSLQMVLYSSLFLQRAHFCSHFCAMFLCRSMGEKYRSEVLVHGGGKHPAELVEGTFLFPLVLSVSILDARALSLIDVVCFLLSGLLGEKPTNQMLVNALMDDIAEK